MSTGPLWAQLGTYGPVLGPCGPKRTLLGLWEPDMVPNRLIWSCKALVWARSGPTSLSLACTPSPLGAHMVPYRLIWSRKGLVWARSGPTSLSPACPPSPWGGEGGGRETWNLGLTPPLGGGGGGGPAKPGTWIIYIYIQCKR